MFEDDIGEMMNVGIGVRFEGPENEIEDAVVREPGDRIDGGELDRRLVPEPPEQGGDVGRVGEHPQQPRRREPPAVISGFQVGDQVVPEGQGEDGLQDDLLLAPHDPDEIDQDGGQDVGPGTVFDGDPGDVLLVRRIKNADDVLFDLLVASGEDPLVALEEKPPEDDEQPQAQDEQAEAEQDAGRPDDDRDRS